MYLDGIRQTVWARSSMDESKPSWKGPYGHKMKLRLVVPANRVTGEKLEDAGLDLVGVTDDGSYILDWAYRSMNYRGDDETALYAATHMLHHTFGIGVGEFKVDWENSSY